MSSRIPISSSHSADPEKQIAGSEIAYYLSRMLVSGDMSDVKFAVSNDSGDVKILSAHRNILSIRSDVFRTMFHGSLPEKCQEAIVISDTDAQAFASMLSYIYTDAQVILNAEHAFRTLACADKYDLPGLIRMCAKFITDDSRKSALNWNTPDIVEGCLSVVDATSVDVLQSDVFTTVGADILQLILQRDTLCNEEHIIYLAAKKWAKEACSRAAVDPSGTNQRVMLGAALHLVRFPLLTDAQLLDGPAKTGLLLKSELWDIFHHKHAAVKPDLPFRMDARQNDSRAEGVINYTVPDLRQLTETFTFSPPIRVRGVPWRIMELLDTANGYVNPSDFSLKLQVYLIADLPVGIEPE
ncbi:BTB/POZ domain-containing protein 3-like [Paramacrobiotus metropolitanus]|uniref:BTB/POZ domain-containing protein 3-like n=1 Tax=Paramacrobiotus metropolitanus TaxID=2943436 RepID=UPI002445F6F5|nr:BTB/POZ domain-containing protein 3-like [Paramacrobiotus metropolitanus]